MKLAGSADVVFHVAAAQDAARVGIFELGKDVGGRLTEGVRHHVQASAMAHPHDGLLRAKVGGVVQNLVQKGNQDGDAFEREALGAEIARLDHLLEEVGLGQPFQNLALVRHRRRLLHALLDPFPPGRVGKMHELDPDASAVIALGLVGFLALEVQFGNGFGQQVLPQRV